VTSYTLAQSEAIACLDEPLQIIACAGSGKTQVISQRIASILSLRGVAPRNVVAFTFTEKAAAELQDRIYSILEQEGVDRLGLAEMYVGTMHGYTLDLLQRLVPDTFKFSVLTEITSRLLVDRNSKKSGLTVCPTSSPGTPTLRR
jgi:DNA helicase-2/ATP-dependent DNA helicase PcrA